jgi:hypothetical protein
MQEGSGDDADCREMVEHRSIQQPRFTMVAVSLISSTSHRTARQRRPKSEATRKFLLGVNRSVLTACDIGPFDVAPGKLI